MMQILKHIKTTNLIVSGKEILWLRLCPYFSSCIALLGATLKARDIRYITDVVTSWGFAQKLLKHWHLARQAELLNVLSQGRIWVEYPSIAMCLMDSELDTSLLLCQNLVGIERHDLFDSWTGDFTLHYHAKWREHLKRNGNLHLTTTEKPFYLLLWESKMKAIVF